MKKKLLALTAAMALSLSLVITGCGNNSTTTTTAATTVASTTEKATTTEATTVASTTEEATTVSATTDGETTAAQDMMTTPKEDAETLAAEVSCTVTVVDPEGASSDFEIKTTYKYLADALLEAGLVEGTDSEYGLYILSVNGIIADYDVDASYWSLNVKDTPSEVGASALEIEEGQTYSLVYTN